MRCDLFHSEQGHHYPAHRVLGQQTLELLSLLEELPRAGARQAEVKARLLGLAEQARRLLLRHFTIEDEDIFPKAKALVRTG